MSAIAELGGDEAIGESSRTFVLQDEGHTLGNALHSIISRYPDVKFCGYTISHPTDNKIHFRIQSNKSTRAIDVMRRGLEDLEKLCDHTVGTFEKEMSNFNSGLENI